MSKTPKGTLKATGARAGDYVIGVAERPLNRGLRLRIHEDQETGRGGRLKGSFEFLAAGDGIYAQYTAALVGRTFESVEEFIGAVQERRGRALHCRDILNGNNLRVEAPAAASAGDEKLLGRVEELRTENGRLAHEIAFLRSHPALVRALKEGSLVCRLTGGLDGSAGTPSEVHPDGTATVEIRFSKLNTPMRGTPTRRWSWSTALASGEKHPPCDLLVLLGEKDHRYPEQYPDDSPYIALLIPRKVLEKMAGEGWMTGATIELSSNFAAIRSARGKALLEHLVPIRTVERLAEGAANPAGDGWSPKTPALGRRSNPDGGGQEEPAPKLEQRIAS